jgi:hypothetical protein
MFRHQQQNPRPWLDISVRQGDGMNLSGTNLTTENIETIVNNINTHNIRIKIFAIDDTSDSNPKILPLFQYLGEAGNITLFKHFANKMDNPVGDLDFVSTNPPTPVVSLGFALASAARNGHIHILDYILTLRKENRCDIQPLYLEELITYVSKQGRVDVLEWLLQNMKTFEYSFGYPEEDAKYPIDYYSTLQVDNAIKQGNLPVIKWWFNAYNDKRLKYFKYTPELLHNCIYTGIFNWFMANAPRQSIAV